MHIEYVFWLMKLLSLTENGNFLKKCVHAESSTSRGPGDNGAAAGHDV